VFQSIMSNRVERATRESKRVLDSAARFRRQKKALEALEQDNFQDEPHADLVMSKKAPKFHESLDASQSGPSKKKRSRTVEYYKQKYRKTMAQLIEDEQVLKPNGPNYLTAEAPSNLPQRHFCTVCGFPAPYTCVNCGAKYCQIRCYSTHQDTRCLKWTA
ncbi:unnamed protein product, partial [Allacma fusca]